MIFDKTLVEKRLADERAQRSQLKFECFTKKKIQELQNYIANFEEREAPRDAPREGGRGWGYTLSGHSAVLDPALESVDKAKELISSLKLENKILKDTIEALKQKTEDSQMRFETELRRTEQFHSQLLEQARAEAATLAEQKGRQLAEMIESKRFLSEQLEALGGRYAQLDQSAFEKIEAMKGRFQEELRRARAEWEAQSNLRFKDWKKKTERQLKESTIKGLEPEIDRILKKCEAEKEKMRAYYEDLQKSQEEGVAGRVQEGLAREKEKMLAENVAFNEKQRALMAEGFEKEVAVLKKTHEMEFSAAMKINEREKHAIGELKAVEAASLRERLDKATRDLKEARNAADERVRLAQAEFQVKIAEQKAMAQKETASAIAEAREKAELKAEEGAKHRVAKLREEMETRQREEIEMLIAKFAEEATAKEQRRPTDDGRTTDSRTGSQNEAGLRTRLAEADQERGYLRQKTGLLGEKVESLKLEKIEAENECFRLRESLEALQSERISLRARLATLEDQLRAAQESLEGRGGEVSRLKTELYEVKSQFESLKLSSEHSLKAYYEGEMEAQQRRFEGELEALQRRVGEVLEAKERVNEGLRKETEFKNSLIRKYEEVLEKQRNDFLSK